MTYFIRGVRTHIIMRKMSEIFAAHTNKTGRKKTFTARFMLDQLPGGTANITKARRLLQIDAQVIAGKHCWLPPKRSLEEALAILGKGSKASVFKIRKTREEKKRLIIPSIKTALTEIGEEHKYSCPAIDALSDLRQIIGTGNHFGVYEAKRELNIRSIRDEGHNGIWYWVWPCFEIQDWLFDRIEKAPVPYETLRLEAENKGWDYRSLSHNRTILASLIESQKINGIWHWMRAES